MPLPLANSFHPNEPSQQTRTLSPSASLRTGSAEASSPLCFIHYAGSRFGSAHGPGCAADRAVHPACRFCHFGGREKLSGNREKLFAHRETLSGGRERLFANRVKIYGNMKRFSGGEKLLPMGGMKFPTAEMSFPMGETYFPIGGRGLLHAGGR
jgi:hypothetical protein